MLLLKLIMSWDANDLNGFMHSSQNNVGQITPDSEIGIEIRKLVARDDVSTILEIGTWNGMGSTRCIVEGLKTRSPSTYTFYSIEANSDKCAFAQNLYNNMERVHILNEVIYNEPCENELEIFPELKEREDYAFWHTIDIENMKDKPLFLLRPNLPSIFDVVLLDGGEFTTWFEYQLLKDRCKILILDDTNTFKCEKIAKEIKSEPNKWKILFESSERQGNIIAERMFN
jgi:hypothetical protein